MIPSNLLCPAAQAERRDDSEMRFVVAVPPCAARPTSLAPPGPCAGPFLSSSSHPSMTASRPNFRIFLSQYFAPHFSILGLSFGSNTLSAILTRTLSSFRHRKPEIASRIIYIPRRSRYGTVPLVIARSSTRPDLAYPQKPDLTHEFTNAYLPTGQDSEGTIQQAVAESNNPNRTLECYLREHCRCVWTQSDCL
jgi:hypothetical protein